MFFARVRPQGPEEARASQVNRCGIVLFTLQVKKPSRFSVMNRFSLPLAAF